MIKVKNISGLYVVLLWTYHDEPIADPWPICMITIADEQNIHLSDV
jgi:hypothetical protein